MLARISYINIFIYFYASLSPPERSYPVRKAPPLCKVGVYPSPHPLCIVGVYPSLRPPYISVGGGLATPRGLRPPPNLHHKILCIFGEA